MAVPGDQTNAAAVAARHDAETVVLYFTVRIGQRLNARAATGSVVPAQAEMTQKRGKCALRRFAP
jgi:hypothetical protein